MQVKLIVIGGKASKREVLLTPPTVLGRHREAGLTVAHPMVSRRHCEVYETDGLAMIRDLGSLNGTYIGGRRIQEAPLPPGEKFSIGPLTFRVEYEYAGNLGALPPVVPYTAETAEFPRESAPAEASRPANVSNHSNKSAGQSAAGPSKTAPSPTGSDDEEDLDELDFQIVEDPEPQVLPAPRVPPTPSRPSGTAAKEEPDPEDQALDDFLKGIN